MLFIAGLLTASLAVVRQILGNEELRELADNLDRGRSAVQSYRDRFGHLPGDDPNTVERWGALVPAGNGSGQIDGDWLYTGPADLDAPDAIPETRLLWLHLRRARMWGGVSEGKRAMGLPANAEGGYIGIQSDNFGLVGPVICLSGLSGHQAQALDKQLDDSRPDTGYVRAAHRPAGAADVTAYTDDGPYFLCRAL